MKACSKPVGVYYNESIVVCGGGKDGAGTPCYENKIGDSTWVRLCPLNEHREGFTMSVAGDKLVVVGGFKSDSDVEIYSHGKWINIPGLEHEKGLVHHCAVSYGDSKVLVIGGFHDGLPTNMVKSIDVSKQNVVRAPDLNFNRYAHSCAHTNWDGEDNIVVAGGFKTFSVCNTVEYISTTSLDGYLSLQKWQTLAPMNIKRYDFGLSMYGTYLAAFGGQPTMTSSEIEIYNPISKSWELVGRTIHHPNRQYFCSIAVPEKFFMAVSKMTTEGWYYPEETSISTTKSTTSTVLVIKITIESFTYPEETTNKPAGYITYPAETSKVFSDPTLYGFTYPDETTEVFPKTTSKSTITTTPTVSKTSTVSMYGQSTTEDSTKSTLKASSKSTTKAASGYSIESSVASSTTTSLSFYTLSTSKLSTECSSSSSSLVSPSKVSSSSTASSSQKYVGYATETTSEKVTNAINGYGSETSKVTSELTSKSTSVGSSTASSSKGYIGYAIETTSDKVITEPTKSSVGYGTEASKTTSKVTSKSTSVVSSSSTASSTTSTAGYAGKTTTDAITTEAPKGYATLESTGYATEAAISYASKSYNGYATEAGFGYMK